MPRVCVYATDLELRTWIVDELSLMTWLGALQLEIASSFDAIGSDRDLVIIGVDSALRARTWRAPTIAIGAADPALADRVLPPSSTSRQLKQAIRELIMDRSAA